MQATRYDNHINHKPPHIVKSPGDDEKEKYAPRILQAGTDAFLSQGPDIRRKGMEQILNPAQPLLKLIHSKPR